MPPPPARYARHARGSERRKPARGAASGVASGVDEASPCARNGASDKNEIIEQGVSGDDR